MYLLRVMDLWYVGERNTMPERQQVLMKTLLSSEGGCPRIGDAIEIERDEGGCDNPIVCHVLSVRWVWRRSEILWPEVVASALDCNDIDSKQRQFLESADWVFSSEK